MKLLAILGFSATALTFYACGMDEEDDKKKDSSFIKVTRAELPECNEDTIGAVAYVTDEKVFANCNGAAWANVSGAGSGGKTYVYDGDSKKLGTLMFADWPNFMTYLSDDSLIGIRHSGVYGTGYCESGLCNKMSTSVVIGNNSAFLSKVTDTLGSNCYYSNQTCTGKCYLSDKPMKNSLFLAGPSDWRRATGSETASAAMNVGSVYRGDLGECVSSVSATFGTINAPYEISTPYSGLPDGMSYPFKGPITVGN